MKFTKPINELVKQRFSCRTYSNQLISDQIKQDLIEFMSSNKIGPFGNTARFELAAAVEGDDQALKNLGTYGFIKGATGYIIGAVKPGKKNLEDFGFLLEAIVLHATDLGLGTCWLGGSFTKSSFARRISAQQNEIVPAVISTGYIADKPRLVERMIRRGAKAKRRLGWECLFYNGDFNKTLNEQEAGDFRLALEMVRLAPSASNRQPWRVVKKDNNWHFFLQRNKGYNKRRSVKLFSNADLQRIDMGIAMCHFELMARDLGLLGSWSAEDPGIEKPDKLTEFISSWEG